MPVGQHAFHLHANPSCADSFNAAGGHYNPKDKLHGFFSGTEYHLGDMPNIHVGKTGKLKIENFIHGLILSPNIPPPGTLIIHAGGDDYISQPSGAAVNALRAGLLNDRFWLCLSQLKLILNFGHIICRSMQTGHTWLPLFWCYLLGRNYFHSDDDR